MIRKARDLKMDLEGAGHRYRDGKPRYLVIGLSMELPPERDHGMGESEMFVLRSADSSFEGPSTPAHQAFGSQ